MNRLFRVNINTLSTHPKEVNLDKNISRKIIYDSERPKYIHDLHHQNRHHQKSEPRESPSYRRRIQNR
eukprot:UN21162